MKRHILHLLAVVSLFVCVTTVWADVQECWQDRQDRGGDHWLDQAYDLAMTIDEDGYVYVTHPKWVVHPPTNREDSDIVTRKYAPSGELVWEATWDGGAEHIPGDDLHPGDVPHAIAVAGGIVCVTGQTLSLSGIDEWNDYVTFCLDAEDGDPLWTSYPDNARRYDYNNEDDEAYAVAMCDGYVYVTGESKDGPDDIDNDVATIKYNASTGARIWVKRWGEHLLDRADYASSIAVDGNCNVYVAGGTQVGILGWDFNWLVISYSPAGNLRWDKEKDGGGIVEVYIDFAWDIVVPSSCSPCAVYVTGQLYQGVLEGRLNYGTVKYRCSDGEELADGIYDYGGDPDAAYGIAADSSCNIYVTGKVWDGSEYDLTTLKYGPGLGDELEVDRYSPGGIGRDIVVDDCDWVYATGSRGNGDNDYLTIKYDPDDLSREWVETQDNGGEDEAWAIVAYACETVYVTGESEDGAGGELEIATKKYSERGACCNCSTGDCIDNVAEEDCQEPWQCWVQCGVCCPTRGDMNCDGVVNAFDIDGFVLALVNPGECEPPDCCLMMADCNCNGVVNAFDIDPFVELLVGP